MTGNDAKIIDVVIVDYRMGNLFSVRQAFRACGVEATVSQDPNALLRADAIVLPGVGAFCDAMSFLRSTGLDEAIVESASRGRHILGICLGQQLLMSQSTEMGTHRGLNLIEGLVTSFPNVTDEADRRVKVPHVGWAPIIPASDANSRTPLLGGCGSEDQVYFVHSYYTTVARDQDLLASSSYAGIRFAAAVQRENVVGLQFHPERSGRVGLGIYASFVSEVRRAASSKRA